MKNLIFTLAVTLFLISNSIAQIFEVVKVKDNGPEDRRVNFVFLPDGYTEGELDKFIVDVNTVVQEFFNQAPLSNYEAYFNAYAIKVPSNVSGAANSPSNLIDNYFGSTFNYAGIQRLLVPTKGHIVTRVLQNNFPSYDQVFVIVNTDTYGGSGGWMATFSTNVQANEIAIHEAGHSFAKLADEYWAGSQYAAEKINMTRETNPASVKWSEWMNHDGVGIYSHSSDASWKKPHQNCKMQFLGRSFCSVCKEGIVKKIHNLSNPIDSFAPQENQIIQALETNLFELDLILPSPNTLTIQWFINGELQDGDTAVLSINQNEFNYGLNEVKAIVRDETSLIRDETHTSSQMKSVVWEFDNLLGVTTIRNTRNEDLEIETRLNSSGNELLISGVPSIAANFEIQLYTVNGQLVNQKNTYWIPGNNQEKLNLEALSSGVYLLKIKGNSYQFSKKFVKP